MGETLEEDDDADGEDPLLFFDPVVGVRRLIGLPVAEKSSLGVIS
jgi:hypothetical protein